MKDEGEVTDLLNIEISRQGASVTLRQTAYIDKLTKEWFPHGAPAHVQLISVPHPEDIRELVIHATGEGAPPADPTLINKYRKLVGALLYAATSTRPDIAYATSMLCRAMSKPTNELMTAALRVLAYLPRHKHVGLRYTVHTMRTPTRGLRRCGLGCEALSIWFRLPTWTSRSILGFQKAGFGRVEHL